MRRGFFLSIALAVSAQSAMAGFISGPVQWTTADGGNDHYYGLFGVDDISWSAARDTAASLTVFGSQGHLVTIMSAAEDTFLMSEFASEIGDPNTNVPGIFAWIGLHDSVAEGNFQWVTGEAFTYSNWAPSEPNNLGGEDFVHVWRRDFGGGPLWSWNDQSDSGFGSVDGFIVEFDGPFTQVVPEPSTLGLLSIGTVVMTVAASVRRRRKQADSLA